MERIIIVALIILALVWVGGCTVNAASNVFDPRSAASAEQIRAQAEQAVQDSAQARAQQQAEWKLAQSQREATGAEFVSLVNVLTSVLKWYLSIGAGIIILFFAVGFGIGAFRATTGFGEALQVAAIMRAGLVFADPATGLYPVYIPTGKQFAAHLNNGQVLALTQTNEPDIRQVLAGSQVQMAGVVSRNAAQAKGSSAPEVVSASTSMPVMNAVAPAPPRLRRAPNHRPKHPPA
jgi:hypothetical protein